MCTLKIRIQVKIYNYTAVLFVLLASISCERLVRKKSLQSVHFTNRWFLDSSYAFPELSGVLHLYENDPGDLTLEQEEQGFDVFYHRERYVYL